MDWGMKIDDFFSTFPSTEYNMFLRQGFLMFLSGCGLRDTASTTSSSVMSVVKCFTVPNFDRAVLEFIHKI
jgi:hypothetical protein